MRHSLETDSLGVALPSDAVEDKPEEGLELHIGSNVFRTTNGVVKLQGKEQLVFEVRPDEPALLVTMDLYDEQGRRVGHIRRNAVTQTTAHLVAVSVAEATDSQADEQRMVVVQDRVMGHTILEAYLFDKRKIRIAAGQFRTHKSDLVTISPHYCRIGTSLTLFGSVHDSRGASASIG